MQFSKLASSLVIAAAILGGSAATAAEPENTMIITLEEGEVTMSARCPDSSVKTPASCGPPGMMSSMGPEPRFS